jgi:hypothetical protein
LKKYLLLILCLCSAASYAQNGFFLQPEIGAGFSNTIWKPGIYPQQVSIFSYRAGMDIGYKTGKWQFITGLAYLRTGVKVLSGTIYYFENNEYLLPIITPPENITDYNPHILVPLKIGYEVLRFSDKLSLTALLGAEISYNIQRTFLTQVTVMPGTYPVNKDVESRQDFNRSGNNSGTMGLAQVNLEYKLNNRVSLTGGPSFQYMFSSMLNFRNEYDYALLMNIGLKWNFKKERQRPQNSGNSK